ncbi:hypothetical protein QUB70_32525 [Microcoleus sp. A003_D6]
MTFYSTIARSRVSAATKGDRTLISCQCTALKDVTINSKNL